MKATNRKAGDNYLPVIVHDSGYQQSLWPPAANIATAKQWAQETIDETRRERQSWKTRTFTVIAATSASANPN